ncbi:MAG: terminase large subunit [Pseudomonadota bacterium]
MALDVACRDWWERLQSGRVPMADLPVRSPKHAAAAVKHFQSFIVPDMPGQPFIGDVSGGWFEEIVAAIFGSTDPKTGARDIRELFLLIAKKNTKTTSAAALALTFMIFNHLRHESTRRRNCACYVLGATQEIADTGFKQAVSMIEDDPAGWLQTQFHINLHLKTITHLDTNVSLRIVTFGPDIVTGKIPFFVLIDEVWRLTSADASSVLTQIRGGMVWSDALLVMISTQSDEPPSGVFEEELMHARAVRDGRMPANGLLPVLYEFPEAMQRDKEKPWLDPAVWKFVNPNMGRSISVEKISELRDKAMFKGEHEVRKWASQHINVQIGMALHSHRWVGIDFWEPAGRQELDLDTIIATSDVCTIGIDGGGADDLLGLAVLGRHREARVWQLWTKAWAQEIVLQRRKDIAAKLQAFDASGDLTITPPGTQDHDELAEIVGRVHDAGLLPEEHGIGVDASGLGSILEALPVGEPVLVAVMQGRWLNGAIKTAERKLGDGTLVHCNQGLMTWCVSNSRAEVRGSATLITKQSSGSAKIDPLAATFNAVQLMSRDPIASGAGVVIAENYEVVA